MSTFILSPVILAVSIPFMYMSGLNQGWQMNQPVCACIGVSACTDREISAFSRAKFQEQNPAGQP
jgi:hypothetical protein